MFRILPVIFVLVASCKAVRPTQKSELQTASTDSSLYSEDLEEYLAALNRGGAYELETVPFESHVDPSKGDDPKCADDPKECRSGASLTSGNPVLSGLPHANQVSLFVMRSPKGIAWSSPRSLLGTTVSNSIGRAPHPIGHVMVEVSCAASAPGQQSYLLAGVSDVNAAMNYALLVAEGAGLDFLFHSFPGRLQTDAEIRGELLSYMNNAAHGQRLAQLTHAVSPATCQRMLKYFAEFQALGVHGAFGLSLRPLYREGSGCSSFSVAFLQIAGLLRTEFNSWLTSVNVPYRLMKSGRVAEGRIIKRAPMRRVALFGDSWATAGENFANLTFWNPDQMYDWIRRAHAARTGTSYTHRGAAGVPIVLLDAEQTPTPAGGFWLQ